MNKTVVKPGDVVRVQLPWSEVCMYMGVAGKVFDVKITEHGVLILNKNGGWYCAPITHGEGGVYTRGDEWYTYTVVAETEDACD